MKKIIFLLSIIFILFLLFSCPSEIIKKTFWEGTIEGDFDQADLKSKHDLEIYIRDDGTCRIIIGFKRNDPLDDLDLSLSGKYTLDNSDYIFNAEVEDREVDNIFQFNGTLNTTTGEGEGEVEFVESYGSDIEEISDWTVEKVY